MQALRLAAARGARAAAVDFDQRCLPLDKANEGIRMFADRENPPVRVVVEP